MTDAPTTPAGGTEPKADTPPATKTFTQDELDRVVSDRLKREREKFADYDALREKATKFDELAESQKTDLERVTGERDTFKTQVEQASVENLRLRVALDKKLPSELIDRLRGGTKEEMEADADQLLKLVAPATPGFDGGARGSGAVPADDMNARLRTAAGR